VLCSKSGLVLNRDEIAALLAFAAKDENDDRSWVSVNVGDGRALVYATDGDRAVEADGMAKGDVALEWYLGRALLERAHRNVERAQVARFAPPGKSQELIRIEDTGRVLCTIKDGQGNVCTQLRFPDMDGRMTPPRTKKHREVGRGIVTPRIQVMNAPKDARVVLTEKDSAIVRVVCRAAGVDRVEVCPPAQPWELATVRASSDDVDSTIWTAKFRPEVQG